MIHVCTVAYCCGQDLDGVFDVRATRSALDNRLRSLESELHQARAAKPASPARCRCVLRKPVNLAVAL